MSKPGIFLGYRLEPGGQWKGDYYVADLEHFRNGFSRPSVHQVKRIWRNPEEGYVFPMLAAYERLTREVQLLDTKERVFPKRMPLPSRTTSSVLMIRVLANLVMTISVLILTPMHLPMFLKGTIGCVMKNRSLGIDIMSMLGKLSSGMIHLHCSSGGPSQADVDDYRVTHLKYLDSTQQCIRDDRKVLIQDIESEFIDSGLV